MHSFVVNLFLDIPPCMNIKKKCQTFCCYRPPPFSYCRFSISNFWFGNETQKDWWFVWMWTKKLQICQQWNVWNICISSYLNIVPSLRPSGCDKLFFVRYDWVDAVNNVQRNGAEAHFAVLIKCCQTRLYTINKSQGTSIW